MTTYLHTGVRFRHTVAEKDTQEVFVITRFNALACLAIPCALASSLCIAQAPAPTPSFTLSASNIAMPSSGTASIPFTLTSVNGFAGSLTLQVTPPTPPPGVKLPYLEIGGPAHLYPLAANATLTGSIGILSAIPVPIPVRFHQPTRQGDRTVWSLATALLLSLGLRRKRAANNLLLALAMPIALTTITACGGPPTLTPGTYTYTLTAAEQNSTLSSSTTITVTVPSGIVTN